MKQVPSLPPHITLHSFTQTNSADLKSAIQPVVEETAQLKINFTSIGFFKQKGTFFLAPLQTAALTAIHRSIHLATYEFKDSDALYQPERWVPHATVANGIAAPFWGPLFARLSMEFQPFTVTATAIECWSINNGQTDNEWSLFFE